MGTSPEDAVYFLLMRSLVPLIGVSPGLFSGDARVIRGIARTATRDTARIFLADDDRINSGIALEFSLSDESGLLDVSDAITHVAHLAMTTTNNPSLAATGLDTHGNAIVPVSHVERISGDRSGEGIFRTLSLILGSGNPFVFDGAYELEGFMRGPGQRCRLYIRVYDDGTVYGVDYPLVDRHGKPNLGTGASLPQELAALARTGDLALQPTIDDTDEYCTTVIDMTAWVSPPPLDPAKSRSRHRANP